MKATGLGIHFGEHPPETSSLDIIVPGQSTIHLSLGDLKAFSANVGSDDEPVIVTGEHIVAALEAIVEKIIPLAVPFKRS